MTRHLRIEHRPAALSRRHLLAAGAVALAAPTHARAQTPVARRAQTLRVAVRQLPASHDPAVAKGLDGVWLDTLAYDALFRWNAGGEMMPALALSWSRHGLDRIVDLVLRPDAFFPDATLLTAEDVRWSLERVQQGGSESADAWRLEHLDRIEAISDTTVRLVMAEPDASLIASLACPALSILPAGTDPPDASAGTGPFRLAEEAPDRLIFRRHPLFWQVNRPRIDTLEVAAIDDDTSRTTALVTGTIDLVPNAPLLDIPTMQQDAGVRLVGGAVSRLCLLQLNLSSSRLRNPDVRRLLARAVDRERVVAIATAGQAEPSSLLFPEDSWARGDADEIETGDPEDIRAELAALGVPAALSLRLIADDSDATLANTAVVLQDQLAYAGIALGVDLLDAQELADATAAGAFDLLVTYTPPWRDPHELVRPLLASDGVQNHAGYSSPRVDALIRNATLTHEQEQRADRYARLQERVLADTPVIVLFRPFAFDAMTSRLTNYALYPPVTSRGLASAVLAPGES